MKQILDKNIYKPITYKYFNIPYLKTNKLFFFKKDEEIIIEEKIDGTNISCYIDENNNYCMNGKRYKLNDKYTNGNSMQWLLSIENKIRNFKNKYGNNYIFYFEFLSLHHVSYSNEYVEQGFLISIKDIEENKYILQKDLYNISEELDIPHAPILYIGKFTKYENYFDLINHSKLGGNINGRETAEGIIIKGASKNNSQKMLKIVSSDFKEIMKYDTKKRDNEIAQRNEIIAEISCVVTEARIRKAVFRILEENSLSTDLKNISDDTKKTLFKNIGREIFYDCKKEEPDIVSKYPKEFGSIAFQLANNFINNL